MEHHADAPIMPLFSMTVGSTEIKPLELSGNSSDSDSRSDPNRFNAYLNRGSELWTHWSWLGGQGKMSLMRCNYCLVNKQLKNAPKCRRHLIKCSKTPEPVRKYFEKKEIEASRVSAFMREIRSKEVKFPRNDKPFEEKLPVPTANDLKHLQQKQHQATLNTALVKQNGNGLTHPVDPLLNGKSKSCPIPSEHSTRIANPLMNTLINTPLLNRPNKSEPKKPDSSSPMNEPVFDLLYQFLTMQQAQQALAESHEALLQPPPLLNGHNSILSNRLKRKHDSLHQGPNNSPGSNKENSHDISHKKLNNSNGNQSNNGNTVVINLDDISLEDSMFFPVDHPPTVINASRKKRSRDSPTEGYVNSPSDSSSHNHSTTNEMDTYHNGFHNQFADNNDTESSPEEINDLLASALLTAGIEFNFLKNVYFQKFINHLLSTSNKNYRLPSMEKLSSVNVGNLMRKFDYNTAKVFAECNSVVISFDRPSPFAIKCKGKAAEKELNVNLLISSRNCCSQLFLRTIISANKHFFVQSEDLNKAVIEQVDSVLNQIGSSRVTAAILPYNDDRTSDLIFECLEARHGHVVPLTNSYQLFHHLLCDICRIPSIFKLITQCMALFQELEFNFSDFQEENQNHWKQVFESDNLKLYKHFLNKEESSSPKNTYWISLNLMLCWFLVARSSIIRLFAGLETQGEGLNELFDKINIETDKREHFFDQISILFNFLTPFINAIHLIENESTVISDIIKIYYDVKLTINKNNFFDGIKAICDKTECAAINRILGSYLHENNFSRFFFLAYYLDPRFREDKRIEDNEDLTASIYDALFCYASALGFVSNEEEDREKLVDSLDEFRNGDKLYGSQLLKCPKSPYKFWKHLLRFPSSKNLANCATRLLSISTRAMFLAAPVDDKCSQTLYQKILSLGDNDESVVPPAEKVLPVKSYLLSRFQKMPLLDDEERTGSATGGNTDPATKSDADSGHGDCASSPGGSSSGHSSAGSSAAECGNITNIISNVITSLEQYSLIIAHPFSSIELTSYATAPSN